MCAQCVDFKDYEQHSKIDISFNSQVTFNNLVPGRLYNITAWTVSGGVTSRPLVRLNRLYPDPVKFLNASDISDTELTITWKKPAGDYDGFQV